MQVQINVEVGVDKVGFRNWEDDNDEEGGSPTILKDQETKYSEMSEG